ncbi:MAG TPA: hypothetical protein VK518_15130 [Puia sp.]|nr:hypothetical protein [Puia sp.]
MILQNAAALWFQQEEEVAVNSLKTIFIRPAGGDRSLVAGWNKQEWMVIKQGLAGVKFVSSVRICHNDNTLF